MTPSELLAALPNGLHDAFLRELQVDFPRAEVRLQFDFWVSDLDAPDEAGMEARRAGVLVLSGVTSIASEPPGPGHRFSDEDGFWVDGDFGTCPGESPPPDDGRIRRWPFIQTWNGRMTIACGDLALHW